MMTTAPQSSNFRIGTEEHKRAFCGVLLDTFDPNKPTLQAWPDLPPDALKRLTSLPFWDVAVETEGYASCRMQALADTLSDPLIKKAIALNAYEEGRHKLILRDMLKFYGIKIDAEKPYGLRSSPEWLFLCTGYGECFDSFFAFGLFKMAKDSGFFPPELVNVFEPIVQEEARHILFFVNWVAYMEVTKGLIGGTLFRLKTLGALACAAWGRASLVGTADQGRSGQNFVVAGGGTLTAGMTMRKLIEVALKENDRRLTPFNRALPRPKIMPWLARLALFFLKLIRRK